MPRKRLTAEEREERRKERNQRVFTRYKHYKGKRGNAANWKRAAMLITGTDLEFRQELALLGLNRLPSNLKDLSRAWRNAIKKEHPDIGGNPVKAAAINNAYDKLKKVIS